MSVAENRFKSWDGAELFYRFWTARKKSNNAIVMFHRGHEHSARWQDVIEKLQLPNVNIFAWDARGHGRSPGERGYAESFGALVRDADAFVAHISKAYGIPFENIIILGHSVGAVIASTWVHDYAPRIRGLVLGSPALRVRLYVPFAVLGLRLLQRFHGKAFVSSYVKGRLLTRDVEKSRSYDNDPLVTPRIAVNILLGLRHAGTRLIKDAAAITAPALVLSSGADFVVEQAPQKTFYDRLANPRKEMQTYEGFRHDTFNELENHLPVGKARMFIEALFADDYRETDLRDADANGFTRREHDALARALPLWSPKRWNFAVTRLLLKSLGRLSKGIRIGWKVGFDSGSMLDYVYENKARGISPFGKLIDRLYLNSPGWRGIRQRQRNVQNFLHQAIRDHLDRGGDVRILDIATGHGRYILDVIKDYGDGRVTALLRDYAEVNIRAGRNLAFAMGLRNVAYEQGNAFDGQTLRNLAASANVAVISGLYELFPDNAMVRQSLAGVANALDEGGTLIYTNQPWHPQLEFIAHVLTSHRQGDAWVMRRRTQQEMDQLVREAGFEKISQTIDEDGIFSVSMARKKLPGSGEKKQEIPNYNLPMLHSVKDEMWAWRTLSP